ncbi:hypothetical protein BB560_000806 [Smittium megazygosporum]|nr:hypothetical protein BB560_000806 [Smittium megazygosporum]
MERVCVYGSGNWGTTAAKIIGENITKLPNFDHKVSIYSHFETFDGVSLSDVINKTHENPKYLPGRKLPENVYATSDEKEALDGATMLVIVVPEQFLESSLRSIYKNIDGRRLKIISLIKGVYIYKDKIMTPTQVIEYALKVTPSVLCGANIANEIAGHEICESTLGSFIKSEADLWYSLFHSDYFRIRCIRDTYGIELCGALKNVVSVAAGIADGLGVGSNSKAAILRVGFKEMRQFIYHRHPYTPPEVFYESCGMADLVASSLGGRNHKIAVELVKTGKSFAELESEMLGGQKLQGPMTAKELYIFNKHEGITEKFPLFTTVYQIGYEKKDPSEIFNVLVGLKLE